MRVRVGIVERVSLSVINGLSIFSLRCSVCFPLNFALKKESMTTVHIFATLEQRDDDSTFIWLFERAWVLVLLASRPSNP